MATRSVTLARTADIPPGELAAFDVEGVRVAIANANGRFFAIGDTCTHGEISLSEGFVEDNAIECWAHGSQFELQTGKPLNLPAYEPVPVFPVTIDGDDVLVDVHNPLTQS